MKIRWALAASNDLVAIVDHIRPDSPVAAERVGRQILERIRSLPEHPSKGRIGRFQGTRELVVHPFIVVYAISEGSIDVLRVLHGRQQWPIDEPT